MKLVLIVILSAFACNVMANDSSAPRISVQGIDPMGNTSGTEFKVYGGNTNDLFAMFPNYKSTMPEYDQMDSKISRTLDIESAGWNLNVTCSKVGANGKALPKGTECTFKLDKKSASWDDDLGDSYDWAPSCSAVD